MRVVIDAMCAEFGGIRTYVDQLLRGWAARYPDDEVHAVLRAGSTLPTPGLHRHELPVRGPDVLGRPLAQATGMHRLVQRLRPDVVLATAPTTNPRRMPTPLAVVILDLRAELRPDQFSRGRRLLRAISYGRSYRLADGFLSISQRSLDDLHELHPGTRSKPGVVAHLGADHVLDWPAPTRSGPAIAFAHHSNKNPELLIEAWHELGRRGQAPELTFLGVSGALRPRLVARIDELGLSDRVRLSPFLPDDEFRRAMSEAAIVAFPSSFEGFGLPIVEAMLLGKPVVIGPDPGALEVAGGHAPTMREWTAPALADALSDALAMSASQVEDARTWASRFTWQQTIDTTRDALRAMASAGTDHSPTTPA